MSEQQLLDFDQRTDREKEFDDFMNTPRGGMIYRRFVSISRQMKQRGFPRYSSKQICGVLRWESDLQYGPDGEGFKINDKWTSRLSRKAELEHPELKGFFTKRELRT